MSMLKQVCVSCLKEKDISLFEWSKNRPNPRKKCKECRYKTRDKEKEYKRHREYQKERRRLFPDKTRESVEKSIYGVCKSDFKYNECWICKSKKRLCIDHCHAAGKPRGLLCSMCNTALGYFKDNTASMERAIKYLVDAPHFELKE